MIQTQIPAPRVPFKDERTGEISREWYRYLFNQFVTLLDVTSTINSGLFNIPGMDGEHGEDGQMGIPGPTGAIGPQGLFVPGPDGQDGEDAFPIPGPQGVQGERGPMGFGMDGDDAEDSFPMFQSGFSGTITSADLVGKTITVANGVIIAYA